MTAARRRSGILVAGIVLVAAGVILLITTNNMRLAALLERLWPLFLVLAGLFRMASFAIDGRPRSPVGGALLAALGLLLLAGRLDSEASPLAIYGKYWILVLALYSLAELLRFYSQRPGNAQQPKFFSLPKFLVVLLITGTGILAGRVAGRGSALLSMARIHPNLAGLADSAPHTYSVQDPSIETDIAAGATVAISNSKGDISLAGGSRSVRVVLTKSINARSEDEARTLTDEIKLLVEKTASGLKINTNRQGSEVRTNIKVEVPRGVGIEAVTRDAGSVTVRGTDGRLSITAAGPVSVTQVAGDVEVIVDGSGGLEVSNVNGNLSVQGARDARIDHVNGSLGLRASNGSLELSDLRGAVTLDAPSCKVRASNLMHDSIIKSGNSTIDVVRSSSLAIDGPGSAIVAQQVSGDLKISCSDGTARLASIQGSLDLSATHSSIVIDGLSGDARVKASYAPVTVKNIRGSASIETSYDRVVIAPGALVGDIEVRNIHGDIKLLVPGPGEFQLNAEAAHGSITCPFSYGVPRVDGSGASLAFGGAGPRFLLSTLGGDIEVGKGLSRRRPD